MVLKKTITDKEFVKISAGIANEMASSPIDYVKAGLITAAIAAEIFSDGEEVLSTMVTNQYIVGDYKYNITTGGDVGEQYRLTIQKGDDKIARVMLPTEADALKYIIKHTANHQRTTI